MDAHFLLVPNVLDSLDKKTTVAFVKICFQNQSEPFLSINTVTPSNDTVVLIFIVATNAV